VNEYIEAYDIIQERIEDLSEYDVLKSEAVDESEQRKKYKQLRHSFLLKIQTYEAEKQGYNLKFQLSALKERWDIVGENGRRIYQGIAAQYERFCLSTSKLRTMSQIVSLKEEITCIFHKIS